MATDASSDSVPLLRDPRRRPTTIRARAQLYAEAVRIIEADYGTDLELGDVARRIATSRRQLQRAFAEIGGAPFRAHLTRIRMARAAELLASSDLPVREVSRAVGYRQPAQFAKSFRQRFGELPSAFRARRLG